MMGFHYRWDPRIQQYAHLAAIMILTPEGQMARYLYGISYRPLDLRFALAEAAEGRSTHGHRKSFAVLLSLRSPVGAYVLFATNFMRGGGRPDRAAARVVPHGG